MRQRVAHAHYQGGIGAEEGAEVEQIVLHYLHWLAGRFSAQFREQRPVGVEGYDFKAYFGEWDRLEAGAAAEIDGDAAQPGSQAE